MRHSYSVNSKEPRRGSNPPSIGCQGKGRNGTLFSQSWTNQTRRVKAAGFLLAGILRSVTVPAPFAFPPGAFVRSTASTHRSPVRWGSACASRSDSLPRYARTQDACNGNTRQQTDHLSRRSFQSLRVRRNKNTALSVCALWHPLNKCKLLCPDFTRFARGGKIRRFVQFYCVDFMLLVVPVIFRLSLIIRWGVRKAVTTVTTPKNTT